MVEQRRWPWPVYTGTEASLFDKIVGFSLLLSPVIVVGLVIWVLV